MATKDNDPDELAELDVEPEQAIKEILDEEDEDSEEPKKRGLVRATLVNWAPTAESFRVKNDPFLGSTKFAKYPLRTSVRSTVELTETDRCDSGYLTFLR